MSGESEHWSQVKDEFLAALDLAPAAARRRLLQLATESPHLAAEVAALVARANDPSPFLDVSALERVAALEPEPEPAPPRVGPWRLESELGRGGMGTVWLGRRDDGAFEQVVAVKFVRPELATDLLRRRLIAERRILAALDHENIARLLDGGVTDEGVPYLVLEHVDGEPIDTWCDHRQLNVGERLRLFLVVCSAVEFAHRKMVLHRDIKSSNVLVDCEGRPKLLDFGIAKLLAAGPTDEAWTALGLEPPLTPEWASPEQLRGATLTTASDVYSLGVLLCTLLTGERPHRLSGRSPGEFARSIEDSGALTARLRRQAAPGVERRALRGDLERILAHALSAEPERRYGTSSELAADLQRFLDGRPISAHPRSTAYRFRKFARRHRVGVTAAMLVALSVVGGILATVREARIAEAERARAERRFTDVRRLANEVLFEVHATLVNVSGTMAARRMLLDNSLHYLDSLALEAADEPTLLAELAAAYERVGEIQGMPDWSGAGRTGDALPSFERALALYRRSRELAESAGSGDLTEARVIGRIGGVLAARGETGAALERHRAALGLLRGVLATAPSTAARLELARVLVSLGDDAWELGDIPAAAEWYGEALTAARNAVTLDPTSTSAIRQVGVVEQRLGDAAAEIRDWSGALQHHSSSLSVDRELAQLSPDDTELQRDLGTDLSRLAADQLALGDAAAALQLHREASRLRQRLLAADPEDARAEDDLAESRLGIGEALVVLRRDAEATVEIEAAVAARRALVARDSGNVRWGDSLAVALAAQAEIEARRGHSAAAAGTRAEILALRRRLALESPDFATNRMALEQLEGPPPGL